MKNSEIGQGQTTYSVPDSGPSIRTVPVGELRPLKGGVVDNIDGITKTTGKKLFTSLWRSHATDIVPGPDASTNLSSELRLLKVETVARSVKRSIHIKKEMCVPPSLPIAHGQSHHCLDSALHI